VKHAPRKRFGQHFLIDASVLGRIGDAVDPRDEDRLVEIGPGLGALTVELLDRVGHLDAVEIDRDLVARLRKTWPQARLTVHEADALTFDFAALAGAGRVRLVGNLPYNISSPLLIRLLSCREAIVDAHFMLQKEVVDRIVSAPGIADFGRLSVMMQAFFMVEKLFDVPPEAFDPPPRVMSSVVRLRPRAVSLAGDIATLERLMAAAFGQRRKMLRGTLLPWLREQGLDLEKVGLTLEPTARPEEISVERWGEIADALWALSERCAR
jgi:16S rRNA (adenine1518-N6/adenine1519-N6)-dimethyltransferase